MAFEEKTLPYEILFRFDETTGALKACHYKTIAVVLKDGVAIAATPSDAREVSLAKGASGLDLEPILGTLATAQQAKLDEQETAIKAHAAELAAKDANAQELLAKLADTQAKLDAEIRNNPAPVVEGGDPVSTAPTKAVSPVVTPPVDPLPVHPLLVPDATPVDPNPTP